MFFFDIEYSYSLMFLLLIEILSMLMLIVYLVVLGSSFSYSGYCTKSCGLHAFGTFTKGLRHEDATFRMPYGIVGDPTDK
jgi:hypothetical protein